MHKLQLFINWIIKAYVARLFKNKQVYVFSGIRRSGNHACINWFTNAIAGQQTKMERQRYLTFQSADKTILHLNEVNVLAPMAYFEFLRENRLLIQQAKTVVISLEDMVPKEKDCLYFPHHAKVIYITRDVLSTLASRLAYNIKRAKQGIDRGDMQIDQSKFNLIKIIRRKKHVWYFDKWLNDKSWRTNFLAEFGLNQDIMPEMSTQGGGSTFHGQNKDQAKAMTDEDRWKEVEWPETVLTLIEKNNELLVSEEKLFLANKEKEY